MYNQVAGQSEVAAPPLARRNGPPTTQEARPVQVALAALADALNVQGNYLGDLRTRLTPALGPEEPGQDCAAKEPCQSSSPSLANIIGALERMVRGHNSRIKDLTHRLEI